MNKVIIGYILLILVTLITSLIGVLKRKAILGFGEMTFNNAISLKFWFNVLTNPYVIGIFGISILMFIGTLIVFSLLTADKVVVMSWSLTIPVFLVTLFFNAILLNEKINPSKLKYLGILLLSVIVAMVGARGYLKG